MADREKLVELVGQVQDCGCDVTDVVEMNYVENGVLVDHLISNSVTVRERGRWELYGDDDDLSCSYFCSQCGYNMDEAEYLDNFSHFRFCPNCGADMRGEEDGT